MKHISYLFISCMTMYHWLSKVCYSTKSSILNLYQHITDYIYNRHITWVLPEGHTLPLPISHVNNVVPSKWTYSDHVLQCISATQPTTYKLSWLSMKLVVDGKDEKEYEMDTFLQDFRILTDENHPPCLSYLFMSWCAETKHWFSHHSTFHFIIIDDEGQERVLNIKHDNKCLGFRDHKIYDYINEPSKKYDYHGIVDPRTFYHG